MNTDVPDTSAWAMADDESKAMMCRHLLEALAPISER